MNAFEKIKETKELLDQGIINEDEYQHIKTRLLDEMVSEPAKKEEPYLTPPAPTPVTRVEPMVNSFGNAGASTGMKVLSFFIPIVGLILFLMDRDRKPAAARDELKWAAIGFGVGLVAYILLIAIGACSASYY